MDRQLRGEPSNGAIFVGAAQFAGPPDPRVAMLLHEDRDVVDHRQANQEMLLTGDV